MSTHPHGEQISAYLDGMLDNAQLRAVAVHLRSCPPCRDLYEDLRQTKRLLASSPAPAAPPSEFWTNTYRRLRTEGDARPVAGVGWAESLRRSWQGSQRRWAAGVAAMAAIGGVLTLPSVISRPPAPAAVVSPAPNEAQDAVDVSALVRAHTSAAAAQPLADPDRQAMLAADVDDSPLGDLSDAEAAAHADATP